MDKWNIVLKRTSSWRILKSLSLFQKTDKVNTVSFVDLSLLALTKKSPSSCRRFLICLLGFKPWNQFSLSISSSNRSSASESSSDVSKSDKTKPNPSS